MDNETNNNNNNVACDDVDSIELGFSEDFHTFTNNETYGSDDSIMDRNYIPCNTSSDNESVEIPRITVTTAAYETGKAVKCSDRSVCKIRDEQRKGPLSNQVKHKRKREGAQLNARLCAYDENVQALVRRKVHRFFMENMNIPSTLNTIFSAVETIPKIVQGEKYYKKYTENDIQKALEEIKIGKLLRVVSRQYKIPRATLQFRKSQNYVKPTFGPNPILSNDEEKILVNWIFENHKRGFPRRKDDVQESVKEFLDQRPRENPFVNNRPGETWYRAFLRRNPEVTKRTSEAVTAASANVSESNIKKWFAEMEDYLTSKGFREILDHPTRVMNADETCFHLCPKNNKVLAPRGARNVYEVEHASSKATLTVMFTFTASGQVTPPMIVYPYKRLPTNIVKSVPPGWEIGLSHTGCMKMDVMCDYIENILHPYLKNIGTIFPVILFLDGHCTHLSYKLSSLCVKLQIILVCLYPNATRIMQPADVAAFKPIKNGWKKAVVEWRTHPLETLTKEHFAPVLKLAVERSAKIETIKHGFRASGLNPWNPDAIDFSKCLGGQNKAPHSTSKNNDGTYLSYKNFANIVGSELLDEFTLREQEYVNDPNEQCLLYKLWKHFTPLKEESNEAVKYSKSTQPLTENVIIEELKEIPTNEESNWNLLNINDFPILFLTDETTTVNQIDSVDPPISQTDTQVTMSRTENQECSKKDSETGVNASETVQDCSISLWYAKTPIRKGKRASEKIPFAITSTQWLKRKAEEEETKKQKLLEKEETKKLRLEKQNEKKKAKNTKKTKNVKKKTTSNV
ncbi:hypothetical protein MML48_9g00000300 [Holotrichia oblita]|uniref:Uncharacterized protein n=1 Tax=Holotrichia oblita TaxID=644536 RepID=A0ACB9SL69_HOLOL|nr:hypothetical protein MML48_9g00000300 [Holotrichia oblita]